MTDLLLDPDTGDLRIENGDFVIGYSDNQNQKLILQFAKGELKEFPEIGVGIESYLDDDNVEGMLIQAKRNLEYDGMRINNISITKEGKLNIDGSY